MYSDNNGNNSYKFFRIKNCDNLIDFEHLKDTYEFPKLPALS